MNAAAESQSNFFTTPVGRLVWGSLTKAKTKNRDGTPILIKSGPDAGKQTQKFEFGLAIPKGSETHWSQTSWGQLIQRTGQEAYPGGQWQAPTFAWKVTDGDSMIPNGSGRAPAMQEGFKGHWVLAFSSAFAPATVDAKGQAAVAPDTIKVGHYVQVNGSVVGGKRDSMKPSVFLNHRFVAHAGFGPEISQGPDAAQAGFGQAPLPAGASSTPVAALPAGQTAVAPAPSQPVTVGQIQQAMAAPPAPVKPHTAFLTPSAPPAPPSGPVMTEKAGNVTYAAMIAAGWTHAQLIEHGYIRAA